MAGCSCGGTVPGTRPPTSALDAASMDAQTPPPDPMVQEQQAFEKLRTLPPPYAPVAVTELSRHCRADAYIPPQPGEQLVHAVIKDSYPYHGAAICSLENGEQKVRDVGFAGSPGPFIVLRSVSLFGNGDEDKPFEFEWNAGYMSISVAYLTAATWPEAQSACPDYSPVRAVRDTFIEKSEWAQALKAVGESTKAREAAAGRAIPTPAEMRFAFVDRESRYWGPCQRGQIEVEKPVVGAQPTHPPDAPGLPPDATSQCEVGAFWQLYDYEQQRIVPLDGGPDALPAATEFICVRLVESNPTAILQTAVAVGDLRMAGAILIAHDASNPRNVVRMLGPSDAQRSEAVRNSLATVELELR